MVDVKTQEKEREADDLKSKPEVDRDGKTVSARSNQQESTCMLDSSRLFSNQTTVSCPPRIIKKPLTPLKGLNNFLKFMLDIIKNSNRI